MKRILLLTALLGFASTASAREIYQVTCTFNDKVIVYTNDMVSDVGYYDYGIRIDLKDGSIIRYGQAVPCEYKKAFTK